MSDSSETRQGSGPLVGRTLGNYRVIEFVGRGAMGAVYKVVNESLGRVAALKILSPDLAMLPGYLDRFQREARAAAGLTHPNIVTVYHVGEEQSHHFIEMEYVEGESLRDLTRREAPLEPGRAVEIAIQIGSALAQAHEKGIIHRDIKPDNVLLTPEGQVKVADFGLARGTDDTGVLTASSCAVGTPLYMAPERFEGVNDDPRSDLYAVGVTLYFMLTGEHPIVGKTIPELVRNHQETVPRPVELLNPAVPPTLGHLVLELLAKEPDERCPDAATMVSRLSGVTFPLQPLSPRQYVLVRLPGKGNHERLPLSPVEHTIGRGAGCNISLRDQKISKVHAVIRPHEGGFRIEDLGSSNGTKVNGEPVMDVALRPGDLVGVGRSLLLFLREKLPGRAPHTQIGDIAAADRAICLVGVSGPARGLELYLGDRPMVIGSGEVDVCLEDPGISSFHAHLYRCARGVRVHDLRSRHGTWVHDKRVRRKVLRDGDRVRMGSSVFQLHIELPAGREEKRTFVVPPTALPPDERAQDSAAVSRPEKSASSPAAPTFPGAESDTHAITRELDRAFATTLPASRWLDVVSGPRKGERIVVGPDPVVVGRGQDAGFVISDPALSKMHIHLAIADGELQFEDLDSRNGVWVNSRRTTGGVLSQGDVVDIGTSRLIVQEGLHAGAGLNRA